MGLVAILGLITGRKKRRAEVTEIAARVYQGLLGDLEARVRNQADRITVLEAEVAHGRHVGPLKDLYIRGLRAHIAASLPPPPPEPPDGLVLD